MSAHRLTSLASPVLKSCALGVAMGLSVGSACADTPESVAEIRNRAIAAVMGGAEKMSELPIEQRKQLVEFVIGNLWFVVTHELGHAVIEEMGIPVLGRLEDAADSYAIVTMLARGTELSLHSLVEATRGWFLSSRRESAENIPMHYFDAHGLSSQRAYQIVCLMVGSDPARFDALADEAHMPRSRRQSCAADFSNASWSWKKVLEPHRRQDTTEPVHITVRYEKGVGDLSIYEKALRATTMLESLANRASQDLSWRRPFSIEARNCGRANASWSAVSRTLVVCYELAADFAHLYRGYGLNVQAEISKK